MVTYPKDWTEECLENITSSIITGGTPSTTNQSFWGGTIPWLASAEIHQKRITRPTTYITDVGLQNSSAKIAPKNSVLIALAGQGKTRGTAAFLQHDMAINQSLAALVVNAKADPEFLFHSMETSYTSLREISSGDGGRGGLNKKLLKKYTIVLPTNVLEQEAIAETLSCMDEHIANLTELIEKKKAIRDGALEDLVNGRTRLKGFNDEWDIRCVGECAYIYSGGTPKTTNPYFWNGDVVWLTPGEITNNKGLYIHTSERKITVDGVNNSSATLLPKGTILLCTRATIGYLAIAETELATNQGFKNLVCKPDIDNVFFAYALMTKKSEMVTKAIGTTFLEISKKALSGIEMRIPLLPEQQAISSVLTAMDEEILALEEEKEKMLQIKAGAMDDLLTGRIRLTRQGG